MAIYGEVISLLSMQLEFFDDDFTDLFDVVEEKDEVAELQV